MIKLEGTMWLLLLMSNQWIFVTPEIDKLTVVCNELSSPQTLMIQKKVKLSLRKNCKAYNANTVIYENTVIETNVTLDFVPRVDLNFDCCVSFEKNMKPLRKYHYEFL